MVAARPQPSEAFAAAVRPLHLDPVDAGLAQAHQHAGIVGRGVAAVAAGPTPEAAAVAEFDPDQRAEGIAPLARDQAQPEPGLGSADIEVQVSNQDGKPVIALTTRVLIALGDPS